MNHRKMTEWYLFQGNATPHTVTLPDPPPWRNFDSNRSQPRIAPPMLPGSREFERGRTYRAEQDEIELVNAALYLRRPLLVTGKPGTGKSSLAYAVAYELNLGRVLNWFVTTRSTLQQGLYRYDAIGRLQDIKNRGDNQKGDNQAEDIGKFIQLGPLGTALLPATQPRVLLIDEIDKSDIDLPNDLLNIFEEGEFEIPELARLPESTEPVLVRPHDGGKPVPVWQGKIQCQEFPLVIMTSNDEREFPPAFLRRCLRLNIPPPEYDKLEKIVVAHLSAASSAQAATERDDMIKRFLAMRQGGDLATDQLLNALYVTMNAISPFGGDRTGLENALLKYLAAPNS